MKDLIFAVILVVPLDPWQIGVRNRRGAFAREARIPILVLDSFADLNPDSTIIHSQFSMVEE